MIAYEEPLFRPPSEAYSVILQVTIGCSHNKCSFCTMYEEKIFQVKKAETIKQEIEILAQYYRNHNNKIFLADGNAFVLSASKLIPILECLNQHFPSLRRVSSYALPKDVLSKSDEELVTLRQLGLKLLYIGIETGDDELLGYINKGESSRSITTALQRLHCAGIDASVMIINGLGGKKYSQQHALNSAKIISETAPKFLSTLTLSFPNRESYFINRFGGEYIRQSMVDLMREMRLFISEISGENIIFRSNHISNNLSLDGILSRDKVNILQQLDHCIEVTPENIYPSLTDYL